MESTWINSYFLFCSVKMLFHLFIYYSFSITIYPPFTLFHPALTTLVSLSMSPFYVLLYSSIP